MKKLNYLFALSLLIISFNGIVACTDTDEPEPSEQNNRRYSRNHYYNKNDQTNYKNTDQNSTPFLIDGKDYTIHRFVIQNMFYYYLWNEEIPETMYYTDYDTPYDIFNAAKYKDDRFSSVMSDYTETNQYFDNDYKTDGLSYNLYYDSEISTNVIGLIEYVYDNSPAKEAGLKRGMVIKEINGTTLNKDNYSELINLNSFTVGYTQAYTTLDENNNPIIKYDGEITTSPTITKRKMYIDPVLKVSTINSGSHKIGYFLYESFDQNTSTIINAISKLKSESITDLVIDLRLNGGGYVSTLDTLASMLVPDGNEGNLFIKQESNKNLTEYYQKNNIEDNDYFTHQDTKLNLNKIYVLVSRNSASASEELISGLKPYMDVVIIGENTYGKYTSNILINDNYDKGTDDNGIPYSEWALYIVVSKCTNANGEMNFLNGFTPDYKVKDTYISELGSETEPLLAKAISLITENDIITKHNYIYPEFNNKCIGNINGKPNNIKYTLLNNK
ncbi:MAG: S41 family peptidase [Bacteroidales bacterium]|nr:S41 family peptidase [Bacteroidales bacterium]